MEKEKKKFEMKPWLTLIIQAIFIVLKLTGQMDCSWWIVLVPLEVLAGFFVLLILAGVALLGFEAEKAVSEE